MAFADRFGLLRDPEGEPLTPWIDAITEMKLAVDCWEETPKGNERPFPGHQLSPRDTKLIGDLELERAKLVKQWESQRGQKYVQANLSAPTPRWESLASKINQNISDVRPVFTFGMLEDGLSVQLMPTNLLEAMWLQFGQAVESNKAFRRCPQCVTWFEVSHKVARFDKVFCTGACKARAYRQRLATQDHGGLRSFQNDEFADANPEKSEG